MTKWVLPVAKAGSAIAAGGLVVFVSVGALRQTPAPQATPAVGAYQAPKDLDTANLPGPVQPILYRHDIHAGQYGIDCQYCHAFAALGPSPGLPSVSVCMGCHQIVATASPEVQKLQQAWTERRPIEWVEVHRMRQFVHFPHSRHVANAQIACQTCHGPIQEMPQVYQYASLKMGWCVSCHEKSTYADNPERQVTTDCTACHY